VPLSFDSLRSAITTLAAQRSPVAAAALPIVDQAQGNLELALKGIGAWYSGGMDRVTGWYKKHTQVWAIILASIITLVMNADALRMASLLWTTPTLRAAMVEQAKVRADKARPDESLPLVEYPDPTEPTDSKPVNVPNDQALTPEEKAELAQLTGWTSDRKAYDDWKKDSKTGKSPWDILLDHLLGWIVTAIAVSMGAPFWFDTLNRFMNIRNAGRSPDEKRDKTSPGPSPANA